MAARLPRLVVNCKTYPEATGRRAVALARAAGRIERTTGVPVAVAVQAVDIANCVAAGARVYAQHFDRVVTAQSTGATRWESLVAAGVEGTLLNHSERRLAPRDLRWHLEAVRRSRAVSLLCARDRGEAGRLARLGPTLLAVEPPRLIGGDVSVTTADPAIVRGTVESVRRVAPRLPVLCGAGVKDGRDARAARALGAHGVLVASGVTLAPRPARALEGLARGLASG